jgi:DNA-binding transcriptional regulator YiaG
MIKQPRKTTKLSQVKFAGLLRVEVSTLRNWEQGRREPTGPAKALTHAIRTVMKIVGAFGVQLSAQAAAD